jgi:hypothetical protein
MVKRYKLYYQVGNQRKVAWVSQGEMEVLNEVAGTEEWFVASELGGTPFTIASSLRKLAVKGLVEQRDTWEGKSVRASYVYRMNAEGEALLVAAKDWGWKGFGRPGIETLI